mmetsp:Transcript_12788/g.32615  ORF Transcript_12788/g.32615 Transcript_12788/m.32615 type:complete len:217 (+) Transcript_12788:40-690(+)
MRIVPLHHHPAHLDAAVELLNRQWARDAKHRRDALLRSCDELPTHFVLVDNTNTVVGHAEVKKAGIYHANAVLLESVVVKPELRGKGLGSMLISHCESFSGQKGFSFMYLNTRHKESFYKKLGYKTCPPISIVNDSLLQCAPSSDLATDPKLPSAAPPAPPVAAKAVSVGPYVVSSAADSAPPPPPPPGPPPPPIPTSKHSAFLTWMVKELRCQAE